MRQRLVYIAVIAVVIITTLLYAAYVSNPSLGEHLYSHTSRPNSHSQNSHKSNHDDHREQEQQQQKENVWNFDYKRDARHYGLSSDQCASAFPLLYQEVERGVKHRKAKKISLDEVDTAWRGDGIVRAMIYDNQLYIIQNRGVWDGNHRPRSIASLHSLHRAITAHPGPLPNIEFTLTDHDGANMAGQKHITWGYSRPISNEEIWLMPDFNFWAWPDVNIRSYAEFTHFVQDEAVDFADKTPQIVWRGSVDVAARDVRTALITQSEGKEWSDVRALDWRNETNIQENLISMDDHCQYMFLAQTEGNTYSGRLKYLLGCGSVVVSHQMKFVEHFTHLLQPDGPRQNYVQVKRDFKDLGAKIEGMLDGQTGMEKAKAVAEEARRTFSQRYLTPAAEACYWRSLIRGWSEVQGFEVKFWEEVHVKGKDGKEKKVRRPRGVPFESYVIMEATEWDIPTKPRKVVEYDW